MNAKTIAIKHRKRYVTRKRSNYTEGMNSVNIVVSDSLNPNSNSSNLHTLTSVNNKETITKDNYLSNPLQPYVPHSQTPCARVFNQANISST